MNKENFFEIAYSVETEAETRAMYDRWAEVYDLDLSKGGYQQPERCAKALATHVNDKGAKTLDVGCGTGLSGLALNKYGFTNIDGCDLSEGMLSKADTLDVYDRLFSCNLNSPPLDVDGETYDALAAVGVFSFGHVKADAMDELLRIAKHGAFIVIGLNDHFYDEGSLVTKLEKLESSGKLEILEREHGEHIPANNLMGWVLTLRKT